VLSDRKVSSNESVRVTFSISVLLFRRPNADMTSRSHDFEVGEISCRLLSQDDLFRFEGYLVWEEREGTTGEKLFTGVKGAKEGEADMFEEGLDTARMDRGFRFIAVIVESWIGIGLTRGGNGVGSIDGGDEKSIGMLQISRLFSQKSSVYLVSASMQGRTGIEFNVGGFRSG